MTSNPVITGPERTDPLPDSAEDLEAVVRAERQRLKRSLDDLGHAVREKVDVRARLVEHPAVTVAAAFTAGAVLGALSNRQAKHSSKQRLLPPASQRTLQGRSMAGGVRDSFGQMATTVVTLIGQRLARVAEDTVRQALARRDDRKRRSDGLRAAAD
jgi:hypothetical protein